MNWRTYISEAEKDEIVARALHLRAVCQGFESMGDEPLTFSPPRVEEND